MSLFPKLTQQDILAFQFSSWYHQFSRVSIKSTIIRPLGEDFIRYLSADGVFVPEGSEDIPAQSSLSDDDGDDEDDDSDPPERYAFPELDAKIRIAIKEYGAVFPKLNFSSPKDASWVLPAGSPLKCTSPADVYLLLKSSDFVQHDVNADSVFEGCDDSAALDSPYSLELVLKKWYHIDTSREFRCFVRNNMLIGISQRDCNFYDFLNEQGTQKKMIQAINLFWDSEVRQNWSSKDYTFDLLLTRDLSRAHIIDFNPWAPRTDPLLFTFEELIDIDGNEATLPIFKVIDSRAHPAATQNAPVHQHNMVPLEALALGSGRDLEDFTRELHEEIKRTAVHDQGGK
ncbi:D123-domain-containing protein [Rickenella mellea]|uniref:D123-domain-containing protein n=1 Tax=Rickenella mellea TaxID=50990 RepID=A0A4Y7Q3M1_9AGAM|nr:D123-domain-containing protein [Rickenella mellea]